MARTRRIKYHGEDVYYHLISRTVGQEFYLGIAEKDYLLELIDKFSSIYFVKLVGFCIMDNHFHIIIKSESSVDYLEEDVNQRVSIITKGKEISHLKKVEVIDKLGNISEYMKSIKETFSRWYNRRKDRTGYFWGDRFKSILLEKKAALSHCLAYIDLNPVRARIVEKPEDYRWNSVYARVCQTNISHRMYFVGLFDEAAYSFKKALLFYRQFLYAVGSIKKSLKGSISVKNATEAKELGFVHFASKDVLISNVRHFTHGCVVGSKEFVTRMYGQFAGKGIYKKDRKVYSTGISENVVSLQRVRIIST